jgi:hypothetical protein
MLKDDVLLHWALVAKCMSQFFQCLNLKSGIDLSPPDSKSTSMSLSAPEDSFRNFTG